MTTFLSWQFWAEFIYFFLAVFVAWYIPGSIILRKLKLDNLSKIVLSIGLGMVMWGWQGIVFGYTNLRFLSYVYLCVAVLTWVFLYRKSISFKFPKLAWDKITTTLIMLGVLLQLTTVWFVGVQENGGYSFCCGNVSDNLYHIALTNQLIKHVPPYEPGLPTAVVHNYHYWTNLVLADLIRVFNLPLIATQFQYSGFLVSLLLGFSAVAFARLNNLSKHITRWLVFFLYFGGDLLYILLSIVSKHLDFSQSSLEDGVKFLANPPRAFSIILLFIGLSMLTIWLKKRDFKTGIIMALVMGSLIGFKVYTGIFALVGLSAVGVYFLGKKDFKMLVPLVIVGVISLVVYLPVNSAAGAFYFIGLWRFENFAAAPSNGLIRFELARVIFMHDNKLFHAYLYDLLFIIIFVISYFGTKLLGLVQSKKSLSILSIPINLILIAGLVFSLSFGLFYEQTTGGANTFNFLVTVFVVGSVYVAISCGYFLQKLDKRTSLVLGFLVVLLTLPRVVYETFNNLSLAYRGGQFNITKNELGAFNYISKNTSTKSLVLVDHRVFQQDKETPYVNFFINRSVFLSGQGILSSHGVNFDNEESLENMIVWSRNARGMLSQYGIDYVITSPQAQFYSGHLLHIAYKNSDVVVYQVNFSDNK